MDGRLQLIEQKLITIDSASFQILGDAYLMLREKDIISAGRTGTQYGEQKTIKGTPDTYFRYGNGNFHCIEYTTKKKGIVKKIKEDLDKCLDEKFTGIPPNEISRIIICFNSELSSKNDSIITKYALDKKVQIELIGLKWLSLQLCYKYQILAKDFLSIPFDTGQLLLLQNFIDEYNNKAGKLATPLNNTFLHRKIELEDIEKKFASDDLLIISGFPGVGKTKIALQFLNIFLSKNFDDASFVVSKKDQDISDDLKIHLWEEKNFVLLIDDANRQVLNLKQILGVFKSKRKGNIKLIITVRDYALNDITKECSEFNFNTIVLNKFSDTEITELISSDSFEIRHSQYQNKIIELADGNARLAVMAARLAKEKQWAFLKGDVSDLYDFYFSTFVKDFDIFSNKTLLKTLAIISFFFTIDRKNKEFIDSILNIFEIDYHEFNEAIDELEKRELVESSYNHTRVSEQVMATYFFYKVFIKDELLSFKDLLANFYIQKWKHRFTETIISSNNLFYYTRPEIIAKLNIVLGDYLETIKNNEEKTLLFFSLFWIYKREELLSFCSEKIKQLPEPETVPSTTKIQTTYSLYLERDETLDFLADLFKNFTESYTSALELAFEYCRKKPKSFPDLIKKIKERLVFDVDDAHDNFRRQREFFNLLIKKFKEKNSSYVKAFWLLSNDFLYHHYRITKGGRKHAIIFYQYPLPFNDLTKGFRNSIWKTLFEEYNNYPKEVFSVIKAFKPGYQPAIQEILEFDLSLLLPFIENKLNPDLFEHIYFVHDFVSWLDREKINDRSYQKLKEKFFSKEYESYIKLDWNTYRGKRNYAFDNHNDFIKLKEEDIRSSFIFTNTNEFQSLHNSIKNMLSVGGGNNYGISESLNIIIEENILRNEELGFQLLESILAKYPKGLSPLHTVIKLIINKSPVWALRLWATLKEWKHNYKTLWRLCFFEYLPNKFIDDFYKEELLQSISSMNIGYYFDFKHYEKFILIDKEIFQKMVQTIIERIEKRNLNISIHSDLFGTFSRFFSGNFELLSIAYIQQEKLYDHFDLDRRGLKELININSEFLIKYITFFYCNDSRWKKSDSHNKLNFVWDLDNYKPLIEQAANLIIDNTNYFSVIEHPMLIFFHDITVEQKEKSKQFILNYILKFHSNNNKMNGIFAVLRSSAMKDFFETAFLYYLSLNNDLESFKKIEWEEHHGGFGNVNVGEVKANDWEKIRDMVNKAENTIDLLSIKTYINKQIENEYKFAESERKRAFLDPNW